MSKRVRPLNIAHHPGAWPPTCMATSCHYADALYSVGYTAVRKTSPALFSAGGCSSVDHQCPLLQWPKITTRPTGNCIQSTMAWLGGGHVHPPNVSAAVAKPPSTSPAVDIACLLGSLVLRVCFVSSSLVGSWPCTIAEAAEPGRASPASSQPRSLLPTYTILMIPVLAESNIPLHDQAPRSISLMGARMELDSRQPAFCFRLPPAGFELILQRSPSTNKKTDIDRLGRVSPSKPPLRTSNPTQPVQAVRDMPGSLEFVGTSLSLQPCAAPGRIPSTQTTDPCHPHSNPLIPSPPNSPQK